MSSTADLIPISESASITGFPDEVWPLLSDPMIVIRCVPGAEITAVRPDSTYEATINVKFGPTVAKFTGEATVDYEHAARRCNIEGRGIDQRGASRAMLSLQVGLEGDDASVLSVVGGFNVSGPLETFASAGGIHVARALLAEFASNMAAVVESGRSESTEGHAASAATATELRGSKLLWSAFLGWLRQLLHRN